MKFLSFSKLFGAGWRGNGKKKHAAKSVLRSRVQLRLEELEDRTTPSVTDVLPSVLTSPTTASDLGAGYARHGGSNVDHLVDFRRAARVRAGLHEQLRPEHALRVLAA